MAVLFIIIPIFIALFAVLAYFGYQAAKKRREALALLAGRLGWSFDPERDRGHDERYAHFELFRRGHSRAAYNTMTGTMTLLGQECHAQMGDFTYKVTSGSGKNRRTTTYHLSYLIVHLPYSGTPPLIIRREGMFDKIASVIGFDDIDFESAEFSRQFHVKSDDKRFAYDIVHPRMMEFLMDGAAPTVDVERDRCCVTDGRRTWGPEQFESMMRWVSGFFEQWPDHVTAQLETSTWSS